MMAKKINWLLWMMASVVLFSGAQAQSSAPVVKNGTWRGVLHRQDGQEIVFNFITKKENGKTVVYIQNAEERLLVDSIRQTGDSLHIQMPFFNSGFAIQIQKNGNWRGNYIKDYGSSTLVMPFTAEYGNSKRYLSTAPPKFDVSGKWAVQFPGTDSVLSRAIGEFTQQPNGKITGTFRTPTGDYRYLEGMVNADSMLLSAFDGGHAVVFIAKLVNDSTIKEASLYSNATGKESWTAKKDADATLPDSYNITRMKPGETRLQFTFRSTDGKTVSLSDPQYKNKVVILQILGSWCPNCMDETAFLSQYYKENKARGVEIIGLAYERTEDFQESKEALAPFRKRFAVQYPFLVTGVTVSDENRTEKTLPQLTNLRAFPTTIFIDKQGNVAEIHTGYDGPATGVHYEEFKKEFDAEMDKLISE